jgi:hypothetical protein
VKRLLALHDVPVVAVALVVLGAGWLLFARGEPPDRTFRLDGLSVRYPGDWLSEAAPAPSSAAFRGEDALSRLEVRVGPRPPLAVTVDAALELERGRRFGSLLQRLESGRRVVGDKTWIRTRFAYAFKPSPDDVPRVASAVEYAYPADPGTPGEHLYVVTLHGSDERVRALEPRVLGSLSVGGAP